MNHTKRRRKGFTLIELLVVIVIITMLAVLFTPKIYERFGKAKAGIARASMANIEQALASFYLDCGRLPEQSEGLDALLTAPPALTEKWDGPYLKPKNLIDPWENPYVYRAQGTVNEGSYDLISYGADGARDGEGENADIYNE